MPISVDDGDFKFRPVGSLLRVNPKPKLQRLATEIIARRGPAKPSLSQPIGILKSAAIKLADTGGNMEALTQRERKAAIELFWIRMHGWNPNVSHIQTWLRWATNEWGSRIGVNRIGMSFLRNFDPASAGTRMVADWIAPRIHEISGAFGEFVRKYRLQDGNAAVDRIVQALADGDISFIDDTGKDVRCGVVVRGSGLLVAIVDAYGRRCSERTTAKSESISRSLLSLVGDHGLLGARGSETMRNSARISMVRGIVSWARRQRHEPSAVDLALEIVISLADDPRKSMAQWRGIEDDIREDVEAWLTARTIENLFMVIDELKTDRQDMWEERRTFWRGYLPYIKKAYLLCAHKAEPIAERLKERYGVFKNADASHCGVLMQLVGPHGDRLTVVEINKNARALFWKQSSTSAPAFFSDYYDRNAMRISSNDQKRHTPGLWQDQFAGLIESETGIRRPITRVSR